MDKRRGPNTRQLSSLAVRVTDQAQAQRAREAGTYEHLEQVEKITAPPSRPVSRPVAQPARETARPSSSPPMSERPVARVGFKGQWVEARIRDVGKKHLTVDCKGVQIGAGETVDIRTKMPDVAPGTFHIRGDVSVMNVYASGCRIRVELAVVAASDGPEAVRAFIRDKMERKPNNNCIQRNGRWTAYTFGLERHIQTGATYKRSRRSRSGSAGTTTDRTK